MKETKYIVAVMRGVTPCQIEDFPKGCARSVEGALHVSPGTMELTEDELKHIRKHHKDVARRFHVSQVGPKAAESMKTKAEAPPVESVLTAPKAKEEKLKKSKTK